MHPETMSQHHYDEPLIIPFSPADTLARLTQVIGALSRDAQSLSDASTRDALKRTQAQLLDAIAQNHTAQIAAALSAAQEALASAFEQVHNDDAKARQLGFPSSEQLRDPFAIAPPDEKTVVATFTLNGKQVLTSLAFLPCAGATAYWLHVVRYWEENGRTERIEDPVLESPVPLFKRVRLPIGQQILRLKSRNPSTSKVSEEFIIEVPDLNFK